MIRPWGVVMLAIAKRHRIVPFLRPVIRKAVIDKLEAIEQDRISVNHN